MPASIKPVSSKKELKIFAKMEKKHYKGDDYHVPLLDQDMKFLLDRKKNAFYKEADVQLFLAYQDNKPVGRISAQIVHSHNKIWKDNIGWFGFWLCPNDEEIAFALLDTAYNWLKERNMDAMRGPANFCFYHEWGMQIHGFPQIHAAMNTHNYYYYVDLLNAWKSSEKRKFEKVVDLISFYYDVEHSDVPAKIKRINDKLLQRGGYKIRTIDKKNFHTEVENILRIYNVAWETNFGSIPMPNELLDHIAKAMKFVYDPQMVLFVENPEGEVIAFQVVLPEVNEIVRDFNGNPFWPIWNIFKFIWRTKFKRTRWCRLWATGLLPEYQKKGIDSMLYQKMISNGKKRGYKHCDISWQLDTNYDINRAIEAVGGRYYKKHRIYEVLIKEDAKTSRPVYDKHMNEMANRMGY